MERNSCKNLFKVISALGLSVVSFLALLFTGTTSLATSIYMDVTSVTSGPPTVGSFTGKLGTVSVTGQLVSGVSGYTINPEAFPYWYAATVLDGFSLQYTNSSIYTPSNTSGDQVGYAMWHGTTGSARLKITFSAPVTDPVFHVANLDSMMYDFTPTGLGVSDLVLLSGNGGGDGDGLTVGLYSGPTIADAMAGTLAGVDPNDPVPTTGARSAYGSVRLSGTFSTLLIDLVRNPASGGGGTYGDGGSFQISADVPAPIPEPSTLLLLGSGLAGLVGLRRRFKIQSLSS